VLDRLRAAVNQLLDAATAPPDPQERVARMREAVLEYRAGIESLRAGLVGTERELTIERRHLENALRRGRLADGIQDQETVAVAQQFAAKHRERIEVLEGKLQAQRAELNLAEREFEDMKGQLKALARSRSATEASRHAEAAWRNLEAAGGVRPETDLQDEGLRADLDRRAREARADEQLETLKRKLGRE
jgi:hypothetical protein